MFEELKKNSEIKGQSVNQPRNAISIQPNKIDEETNFLHKSPQTISANGVPRSSATYCLKITLESLVPFNCPNYLDEKSQDTELCVNLYLYKENTSDSSYYLWYVYYILLFLNKNYSLLI